MSGQGWKTKVAVARQSEFGIAVSVTDLVTFTGESISKNIETVESEFLDGIYGKKQIYHGFESGAGEIRGEAVIDEIETDPIGWEHFILGTIGSAAFTLSTNIYKPQESLPLLTVAVQKYHGNNAKVWEFRSAKVNTLEVSGAVGTAGGKVSWTASLVGEKVLRTGEAGIVNTTADFSNITPANKPEPLLMSKMALKIGDTDDALTDSDRIAIEEFTLTINNNLSDDTFASITASHTDGSLPIEHERNGRQEVTLRIVRPRLYDMTFFDWFSRNTTLQALLEFSTVGGTYSHKIYLPYLKIAEDPSAEVGGPELLKEEINLVAVYNTSNLNANMTLSDGSTITGQIAWEAKSKRTAVPS